MVLNLCTERQIFKTGEKKGQSEDCKEAEREPLMWTASKTSRGTGAGTSSKMEDESDPPLTSTGPP